MNDSTLIKRIHLKSDEYVSVISDFIDEDSISSIAHKKNLVGVFATAGAGKSSLMKSKAQKNKDLGIHTVIVTPCISLSEMLSNDLNASKNFDSHKYTKLSDRVVVTTADSLLKLVDKFEENNIYFEMHVDEVHERIDSAKFRNKAFENIDYALASDFCTCCFMYTATEDAVKHYYNFDKVYKIEKQSKEIRNAKVITTEKLTNECIKDCIEYTYTKCREKNEQLFVFLNDKTKQEYVDEKLDLDIFKFNNIDKSKILLISSKTKDDENIKEMIKNKHINKDYQVIMITSTVAAGIEFFLDDKATVLVFCNNYTFNINQEIQSTIRVRSNINDLIFVKKEYKNSDKYTYISYDDFFQKKYSKYKLKLEQKIQFYDEIKNKDIYYKAFNKYSKKLILNAICYESTGTGALEDDSKKEAYSSALVYKEKTDTLEIDEALLNNFIWNEYSKLILKNTNNFIRYMKERCNHFNLKYKNFEVLKYEDLIKNEELEKISSDKDKNKNKDKDKDKNKEKKLLISKYKKVLKDYNLDINNKIEIIFNTEESTSSKFIYKELFDCIEILSNIDSTFKALKELLQLTSDIRQKQEYYNEYLNDVSTHKLNQYIKYEIFKLNINIAYMHLNSSEEIISKQTIEVREIIYILKYIQNKSKNKDYRNVRINKNSRQEIFEVLQKSKLYEDITFTDETDKKLFNLLSNIFNLTEIKNKVNKVNKVNKSYIITSLKYKMVKNKN